MSIIDSAVNWAVSIANDNSHGYSQTVRWGPSYDCSSLVISAFEQAGLDVKSAGASYTGNMYSAFCRKGFTDVTDQVNLASGSGLQTGDVLLNDASHTALYIGSGRLVHARSSEGTSDTADGSGNEIRTQAYFNYPWTHILRLGSTSTNSTASSNTSTNSSNSSTTTATTTTTSGGKCAVYLPIIKLGSRGTSVKRLQILLNQMGYSCGTADGIAGANTIAGIKKYQTANNLSADGIVGTATWSKLFPM